jgi:Zn-dependent protease with chaperone function
MNLYEQQSANRRRTWLIMLAFVAVLFFLGVGFDAFSMGTTGGYVPTGRRGGLGDGGRHAQLRQLDNVVDEMAIAAGLPRPTVYVVPDADPNAFATARPRTRVPRGHARIARCARPRRAARGRRARDEPHQESRLFASHPPMSARIAALKEMAFGDGRRR